MRDFSWKYFTLTGDVESFMLYREMDQCYASAGPDPDEEEEWMAADAGEF